MLANIQIWFDKIPTVVDMGLTIVGSLSMLTTATKNQSGNRFLNTALKVLNFFAFNFGRNRNA